jgi:5-(carboxyamino)imidazole ribonucleotide synthase
MGEGAGGRVVVAVEGASLRRMLDEEIRRKGLRCDVVDAPAGPAKRPVENAARVSVLVARSSSGELRAYPAAENVYQDGLLRTTLVPAQLDASAAEKAALDALNGREGAGVFAVEMTVDAAKAIAVHDVVPGVHNTGHYTIEACRTSQYEQHVRAVSGLPLGETTLLYAAVTVKLYGACSAEGADSVRSIPGAFVHWYGRPVTDPRQVWGHVTVVGVNHPAYRDALIHRAHSIRTMIVQKESRP